MDETRRAALRPPTTTRRYPGYRRYPGPRPARVGRELQLSSEHHAAAGPIRDRDSKFTPAYDAAFAAACQRILKTDRPGFSEGRSPCRAGQGGARPPPTRHASAQPRVDDEPPARGRPTLTVCPSMPPVSAAALTAKPVPTCFARTGRGSWLTPMPSRWSGRPLGVVAFGPHRIRPQRGALDTHSSAPGGSVRYWLGQRSSEPRRHPLLRAVSVNGPSEGRSWWSQGR